MHNRIILMVYFGFIFPVFSGDAARAQGPIAPPILRYATYRPFVDNQGGTQPVYPLFTLLPSGPTPTLMLNQPIGISVWFTVAQCLSPDACPNVSFQSGFGWMSANYSFKAVWTGASQVDTYTNPGNCVSWTAWDLLTETGEFSTYAYFSSPGTKSVTITATPCAPFPDYLATPVSKTFTFTVGGGLLDPGYEALAPGSNLVATSPDNVLTNSRPVMGVAADGVSLALAAIPTPNVGDSVSVTLLNDQNSVSWAPAEDGGLGLPGDSAFPGNSVTAIAIPTDNQGPQAFVVYQAPLDFARISSGGGYKTGSCPGLQTGTDDTLSCRSVSLQIQISSGGTNSTQTIPVSIVRPPVVLIHGLWGDATNWNNFGPLYSNGQTDSRFYVKTANYVDKFQGKVASTVPASAISIFSSLKYNALGLDANAQRMIPLISGIIKSFALGLGPAQIPVVATQADFVGHSMGGLVSRTMPLETNFYSPDTYGQGIIHKLITIDTPHLGSQLADVLLDPANSCSSSFLAIAGMPSLQSATLRNGQTISGAVGDLSPTSNAIARIGQVQSNQHPIPTAFIAGIANSANYATTSTCYQCASFYLGTACGGEPIVKALNIPSLQPWSNFFGGLQNDAIVSLPSQLNGLSTSAGVVYGSAGGQGYIHSPGTEQIGFAPPTMLDPGQVPLTVIQLLNTPYTNSSIFNSTTP